MANQPQTVREFAQNLLSDVERDAITVQEAIVAASQYELLRQELSGASLILGHAAATGDEELTRAFIDVISGAVKTLGELPSFQTQQPDLPKEEKVIRDIASLQKTAVERLRRTAQNPSYKEARRVFIHALITQFSSTMPAISDRQLEPLVEDSLRAAATETDTQQGREQFVKELVNSMEQATGNLPDNQKNALQSEIRSVVTDQNAYVASGLQQAKRELEVCATLFRSPDLTRPDVFVDVVLHAPPDEDLATSLSRAGKLARVAQALEAQGDKPGGRLQFFSASGARGIMGGLQKGADGILSLVGEPVRDMILQEKISGSLRNMLTNTQRFADRLGETFVKSALFTHVSQDLTRQLAEKPSSGQARTVINDLFSSVFRGPLHPALNRATEQGILDYYELSRASAAAPKGKAFLPPGLRIWDVFREHESVHGQSPSRAMRRSAFGLPLFGFGPISSFISTITSSFVDRVTSLTLANSKLPGQLASSRRAAAIPTRLVDDMPLMAALVVVVVIVLLFLFPSPFNINQINHSSKVSALLATLQNKEGNQGEDSETVDCTTNPTHPLCSFKSCVGDCRWPTSGYITQGPNVQCDKTASHHSGEDSNAVDIATVGSPNMPVYAIDGGTVRYINSSCKDNSGKIGDSCGYGYGNYVTIGHDNGYLIIYAHLKKAINPLLRVGGRVTAHQQIGWMDQTGNSSGQHLHFGVLSGGNVLDVLPDTPINKSEIAGCNNSFKCWASGHGCPATPVSAQ